MQTKRIIVLSDGTGNSAAKIWRTNVWRLFDALDKQRGDQVAFYDDGVGTSSFKPLAVIGGAFGYGLKRNVIECYKYICRNYTNNAEIFLFGFSRGAFTIRVLIELIASQGIVRHDGSENDLSRQATAAFRAYRRQLHTILNIEKPFRLLRDLFVPKRLDTWPGQPKIKFVGLWDTVAAYGLPIEELTLFVSRFFYPLGLVSDELPDIVLRACHALSLDDERKTFHPLILREPDPGTPEPGTKIERNVSLERITQVWFAGVHANVGGGYPDDSMAYIPLQWMIEQVQGQLDFKTKPNAEPDHVRMIATSGDRHGRLYNSRSGLGAYYRYAPRDVADLSFSKAVHLPKIHASVFKRISAQVQPYAPLGLPCNYEVVDHDGKILSSETFEPKHTSFYRFQHQALVWNLVFIRSIVYLTIVGLTAMLFLLPFISNNSKLAPSWWTVVSDIIQIVGAPLPGFAGLWINAYANNPGKFLSALILLLFFLAYHAGLKVRISDAMFKVWREGTSNELQPPRPGLLFRLRTSYARIYFRKFVMSVLLPTAITIVIGLLGISTALHIAFNVIDAAGGVCHRLPETNQPPRLRPLMKIFPLDAICWNSGHTVKAGERYLVQVKLPDVDLRGGDNPISRLVFPLKRSWSRPVGTVIMRLGREGYDEWFLDPDSPGASNFQVLQEAFRAPRDAQVYFYLNELVLPGFSAERSFGRSALRGQKAVVTIRQR
jgi:uncharacterized protein (DUF2235 family)